MKKSSIKRSQYYASGYREGIVTELSSKIIRASDNILGY